MIQIKAFTVVAVLFGLLAPQISAADAEPSNISADITISPETPSKTWPEASKPDDAILSPNYTATLKITVETGGTVGNVEYVLDGKPKFDTNRSDTNIIWSLSGGDNSKTLSVTNTALNAATASLSVSCKWKPKPGSGKGKGTAPQPIPGSAAATASLIDSAVTWEFDRTLQLANGTRVIKWKITFKDAKGRPLKNITGDVISAVELDPASAAWTITPDPSDPQTPGNVRTGTAKSSDGSTGKLKVDYNDGSAETNTSATLLTFAKAVFKELAADKAFDFAFHGDRPQPGLYKLGGKTNHLGKVQIIPKSARGKFKLRLYQQINSLVKIPNTTFANVPFIGVDTVYNGYSGSYSEEGEDILKIESFDFPGPALTAAGWEKMGVGPTGTVDMNFNLYMQYLFADDQEWLTSGKAVWGMHGTLKFNESGVPVTTGNVSPGIGAASSETPQNPASSNTP